MNEEVKRPPLNERHLRKPSEDNKNKKDFETKKDNTTNTKSYNKNIEIYNAAKAKSVVEKEQEFKPEKKKLSIKKIAIAIGLTLAIAVPTEIHFLNNLIEDNNRNAQILSIVNDEVVAPEFGRDIIRENIYTVNFDAATGEFTYAYDTEKIANQILKRDPEYFDLIIYNVYENMDINVNKNINELFHFINRYSYKIKDTNPELYHKVQNFDNFDDYLKTIKCVDENNVPSLEKFKKNGKYLYEYYKENLDINYGGRTK